jgi:hypothetical protein
MTLPISKRTGRVLSASLYISLFIIMTYAMTAYGFYKGEASFTVGIQIGCIMLGLLLSTFSYLMWCLMVGGYDVIYGITVMIANMATKRKNMPPMGETDSDKVAYSAKETVNGETLPLRGYHDHHARPCTVSHAHKCLDCGIGCYVETKIFAPAEQSEHTESDKPIAVCPHEPTDTIEGPKELSESSEPIEPAEYEPFLF